MRRSRGLAGFGCLLLFGCSSTAPEPSPEPSSATSSASSPAAVERSLADTCPMVEAALPNGGFPSAARLDKFLGVLRDLHAEGDLETQNALGLLGQPTQDLYDVMAADRDGYKGFSERLDANSAWLDGISALAKRCKAVGSSALQ